jgi:hypothetical protein
MKASYYDNCQGFCLLPSTEQGSQDQRHYSDWYRGSIGNKVVVNFADSEEDLKLTPKNEKEIKFQKGNVHLRISEKFLDNDDATPEPGR